MLTRTGSLGSLREQNLLAVVDALRTGGAASRAELARRTGLSRTTVSTLVGELQARGLVVTGETAHGGTGRPGVLLALDPTAAGGIGIDFNHDRVAVAVSDLGRNVLAEAVETFDVDHDAIAAVELAASLAGRVLDEAGLDRSRVLGAGVALAGPVDHRTGIVRDTPILPGWRGIDAASALSERLGVPVQVDNDANLGALAEASFGAGAGSDVVLYVSVSSGIGAGLVDHGRPYRGSGGVAGEVGHLLVDADGRICRCGNRGCLETVATGPALVQLMRDSRGGDLALDDIIRASNAGDVGCRRAVGDAGRAIGQVLGGIVSVLGPDVLIVGGQLSRAGDVLLTPLADAVTRYALPTATERLRIVPGALGERANLLGALALATTHGSDAVAARLVAAAA